jgi:hypothetical protein
MSVCLYMYLSSMQSVSAVLYCHLWHVWLYHICSHRFINSPTFFGGGGEGGVTEYKMCFDFLYNSCLKRLSF